MRLWIQYQGDPSQGWSEIDSSEWSAVAKHIAAINVQGIIFSDMDWYTVYESPGGWFGKPAVHLEMENKQLRIARRLSFRPLETLSDGSIKTQQHQEVFLSGIPYLLASNLGTINNLKVSSFLDWIPSPNTYRIRGVRYKALRMQDYRASLLKDPREWRHYTEDIEDHTRKHNGRILNATFGPKRPAQYLYLRHDLYPLTEEDYYYGLGHGPANVCSPHNTSLDSGDTGILCRWRTAPGILQRRTWHTGSCGTSLDVLSSDAGLIYGFTSHLDIPGGWRRLDKDGTFQEAAYSPQQLTWGTGLKRFETPRYTWREGRIDDCLEVALAGFSLNPRPLNPHSFRLDMDTYDTYTYLGA